jgi:signal transduction histidine kinase/ActR/RegA family two-component response regulator
MERSPNAWLRYGVALAAVAVTLQVTLLARSYLTVMPESTFVAAVAVASWYGGVWPGLLSTVLSALAVDYFLIPPLYEINFDAGHLFRLTTFVIVSLVISSLHHSLKRETKRAEEREQDALRELAERQRVESERAALLEREREARRQVERAQGRLLFLAEAGRLVTVALDFEATLADVGRLIVSGMSDWCFVYLLQGGGVVRRAAVAAPPAADALAREIRSRLPSAKLGQTPVAQRVLQGECLLLSEVTDDVLRGMAEDDEHLRLLRAVHAAAIMIVPLRVHRRVFGAMAFVSTSDRRFSTDDLAVAEEVAGRAAAALSNAQLYEEAQDANRMKDEFLATVSHELRTPLHAILGWTRLLRGGALAGDAAARALETIERNAQAQAELVADILDVSRIVTGKLKLDLRPVSIATVVESALDGIRPAAHAKNIEIEATVPDPAVAVLGDAGRLQQIVWNLLSNAIKFTPAGGHVGIAVRRTVGEAEIAVVDTGIGIDREFLPYVFDRFRQADSSTSRSHGGLGLGLAIVRHLTELHGGRVRVESDGPGAGATFTVHLPAMASGPSTIARRVSSGPFVAASALRGLRVLAVDDQADARELISTSLERYGAIVATAASAREAFTLIDAERPDVLIGDIGMPDEDGYALIRRLRARPEPQGGRIPAIALTAYARHEDQARSLEAGYQIHLSKPIDDDELAEAVATLAGRAIG